MAGPAQGEHARLMDRVYRRQRHIYDLTRKYYLFGRDRTIRRLDLGPGEKLVEIGCGTARNLVAIARRYPGAVLFGLDASHEMLKTAEANLRAQGLSGKIRLAQAYAESLDASTFGPGSGLFDRVLFSYSLSMIPDWRAALGAAAATLRPGGTVHIVDFGDLGGLGRIAGGLLRQWLRLFHVSPRAELLQSIEQPGRAQDTKGIARRAQEDAKRIARKNMEGELWVSTGRYAFAFRASPEVLVGLGLCHVAQGSQSLTKP